MLIVRDCPDCTENGQYIELRLIRANKHLTWLMARADVLEWKDGDIAGAYCTVCGQMVEIDDTND